MWGASIWLRPVLWAAPVLCVALTTGVGVSVASAAEHSVAGAAPFYLPDPACTPVDLGADDTEHAFRPPGAAVIKVIYANPMDEPSQFDAYYGKISQAVA